MAVQAQTEAETDWHASTTFEVQLRESGDAAWDVRMRYRLDGPNETATFRTYADAFERGEAAGAVRPAVFEGLAAGASEAAGREMEIRDVNRSSSLEGDAGVLTLSFTWTNFLGRAPGGDQYVLRDALLTPDGRTWLATLEPDQRLVVETPPGYTINATSVPVLQRSGTVIIDGPRSFPAEEPLTIRYQPATGVGQIPWALVVGGLVALVVVLGVLLRRRGSPLPRGRGADGDAGSAGAADATAAGTATGTDGDGGVNGDGGPGTAPPTSGGADADADADADSAPGEQEEDLSLLSDEERVERLLERNGGRMRQAQIVEESGWSDAKVSQLLSAMADEERVEKLRIGRENLISLPDTDVIDEADDGE
jgi:LPXTG-motif cell wall-anchored protein